MDLKALQKEAHATAKDHGWWDEERTFGDCIALVHSELSEALEAYRAWGMQSYQIATDGSTAASPPYEPVAQKDWKPEGVAYELADVVIRVADMAEWLKVDLAQAREEDEDLGDEKQAYLQERLSGNLDSFGEWIAAIHEDVGDAGYHQRNRSDNLGSHLVSVIWMVQEMADHYGIHLDAAIEAKMETIQRDVQLFRIVGGVIKVERGQ